MFQVGATCYPTRTAALQAAASSSSGLVVEHAGAAHVVTVTNVGEDGIEYSLTPIAGGPAIVNQVFQQPQPCNLMTFSDVSPIVWAIAAGWLAVFIIRSLTRAVPHDT